MIYRRLYIVVIVRVLGILANSLVLAFVWYEYRDIVLLINFLALLIVQVVLFIRRLNKVNRDLEHFFSTVRNSDTSVKFSSNRTKEYQNLYKQFDLINKDILGIKIKNQNQDQYFKVLVEHVAIGLISIDSNGKVLLFNKAAQDIFNRIHLYRLEDLNRIQEGLSDVIHEIEPSQKRLISLHRNNELVQLAIKASKLKLSGQEIKLVSFQNIQQELDEKELDAWQKLIRVLTHEIMNSLSPINSSIGTISEIFRNRKQEGGQIKQEESEDVVTGLEIIEERTIGMVDFVSRFRDLTLLPSPKFKQVNLVDRVNQILKLLKENLQLENIQVNLVHPKNGVEVNADPAMLDQILLNLINNSIHALRACDNKQIEIRVSESKEPSIDIEDNGCGISEENREEIFTPFFTTKENGSGVGLSLSRQLMKLHKGSLTFTSQQGGPTIFKIQFNS
ncbi:sensor histidine kinase [Marinifilum sp. D737]|uniref:sensor histidine kinase n=1 Tax=Marinifilum sp. D737 TaxID=2969628 RepID=UPI0022750006|nr:ATP-binding protein [Marinifilum sp. D737]MCY1634249.1 ATP-binding protein [Marinifilum sp. D737]